MAIRIKCACGRLVGASEAAVGRRLPCPACGELVTVPSDSLDGGLRPADWPAGPLEEHVASVAEPPEEVDAADETADGLDTEPPVDEEVPIYLGPAESPPEGDSVAEVPSRQHRRRAVEVRQEHEDAMRDLTLGRAFIESLRFPIRGWTAATTCLLAIPVCVLTMVGVFLWCVGLPFLGAAAALGLGWLREIVRSAAGGPQSRPTWSSLDVVGERVVPSLVLLGHFGVVVVLPATATVMLLRIVGVNVEEGVGRRVADTIYVLILLSSVLVYYSMSFCIVAIHDHAFFNSLNPRVVFASIRRVGREYVLVVAFAILLVILGVSVIAVLNADWLEVLRSSPLPIPRGLLDAIEIVLPLAVVLTPFLPFYFFCVIAARLGFMIYRSREALGWE